MTWGRGLVREMHTIQAILALTRDDTMRLVTIDHEDPERDGRGDRAPHRPRPMLYLRGYLWCRVTRPARPRARARAAP